jgi:uncharacterized protein YtpQ (UPF0354 family)
MSFLKKIFKKAPLVDTDNSKTEPIYNLYHDKIYPWVKVTFTDDDPNDNSTQLILTGDDSPIFKNWLGDLTIFYVADTGDNFQILLERDLPVDITKEALHNLAVDNLNRDIEFKLHDTNFGGHGLIAGGHHEAGSICLPEMWDWLTNHLGDNLIVGIPSKDLVIVVPESDTDKISNLKIFVHEIFKDGERLLTRNIFKYDRETKEWTIVDRVN